MRMILVLLLVASSAGAYYFYNQAQASREEIAQLAATRQAGQGKLDDLSGRVAKGRDELKKSQEALQAREADLKEAQAGLAKAESRLAALAAAPKAAPAAAAPAPAVPELPREVTVTRGTDVALMEGGQSIGKMRIEAGTKVNPVPRSADVVTVAIGAGTGQIPLSATDLLDLSVKPVEAAASAPKAKAPPERDAIYPLVQRQLVSLDGKDVRDCSDIRLAGIKYYAVYYSAQWCPPCHAFTPKLVAFYKAFKEAHPDFELIFVSMDNDDAAMRDYMREMAMPWPAVRYAALDRDPKDPFRGPGIRQFAGNGIPDLVLLNAAGTVLSDSYAGGQYVGPEKVMNDIASLVPASAAN